MLAVEVSHDVIAFMQFIVLAVIGVMVFKSARHRQADDAMARTIEALTEENAYLRRRMKNGGME